MQAHRLCTEPAAKEWNVVQSLAIDSDAELSETTVA